MFNIPEAYQLIKTEEIPDIQSTGYLLRHTKSGARVALLVNDDENKVFSVGFRTPPPDSTGVPHIMEHSVLCGSKNFPVKDPFVELVKGSLNTFLNAMTFPDKTLYPVASCNDKDFQNLMNVYMDAVFYPNIYRYPEIFRQEGWSYEMDTPDSELKINGVVYNEMKGAFSSPDDVLSREVFNSLFPDTCYGLESGGDPAVIPELTYEAFLEFHRTYYHPSNSYIYLYGNMDMEEKLNWLDSAYLNDFERIHVESGIPVQPSYEKPVEKEIAYPVGEEDDLEESTYHSYNKVIGTSSDTLLMQAMDILDYALLSAPGAPLEKALLEAGIGQDVIGSFESDIMQPFFSVAVKNSDPEKRDAFLSTIRETLEDVVKNGIDRNALCAAINYFEFRVREADYGRMPKGLINNMMMLSTWLYDDDDPWSALHTLENFRYLREQVDTGYFEDLVRKYLLDNPHGSYVSVVPERGLATRRDQALQEKLAAYKSQLSDEDVKRIASDTASLRTYQESPERQEDIERLPVLERSDLNPLARGFLNTVMEAEHATIVHHAYETNGIGYVKLLFDLSAFPEEMTPMISFLQSVLGLVDTEHYSYGDLFNEINLHTGGISSSIQIVTRQTADAEIGNYKPFLEIKGKALYDKIPHLFRMMQEILGCSKLTETVRIREILLQSISRLQGRFQTAGHAVAVARAAGNLGGAAHYKEDSENLTYYGILKALSDCYDERKEELSELINHLLSEILKQPLLVSYTGDAESAVLVKTQVEALCEALTGKEAAYAGTLAKDLYAAGCNSALQKREAFTSASAVQYVARTGNFRNAGLSYTGALHVLRPVLNYGYLWEQIRVTGGAYGCMSGLARTGDGYFVSYRDPHLARTYDVFEGIPAYLESFVCDERTMTKYIIGAVSDIDMPMMPEALGARAINAYLSGLTLETLQKERNELLTATPENVQALAPYVRAILDEGTLCVLGGEEKIAQTRIEFDSVKGLL